METLNLYPRYILLTHGHFDHLAALPALFSHYRGGPEIAIHRDDAGYLGPGAYQVHRASFTAAAGNASYVDSLWEDMPSPSRLLGDGDTIGPFRVIHLPGHTPGSAGFLFDGSRSGPGKPGEKLIFSGDTLFRAGVGRTDLPGGDLNRLRESLMRFLAMDEEINVYPGHGPVTSVGEEKAFWSHGL
jgi:glyoxylase-like metal-dependent hydrolase (beta-lactamase superfamily II)